MIKKIILILVFVLSLTTTFQARAQDDIEKFHLVILGDSLASGYGLGKGEGFVDLLQDISSKTDWIMLPLSMPLFRAIKHQMVC